MFPIFAGNSASTGYNLTRSLRFRASASATLVKTFASGGNQKTWTLSFWVKRGTLGTAQAIFDTGVFTSSDSTLAILGFTASDTINFSAYSFSYRTTTQVFRDPSAWYHIVLAFDTTQATAANRVKLYVNGTQVTAFSSSTDPTLNTNYAVNQSAYSHTFGYPSYSYGYFDGYLAEVNFIDGQALTPSSFGSTNVLTGVWQPAAYTGSYGTTGFVLDFEDNSALTTSSNAGLGKDTSGNGNYFPTTNISITAGATYDSMTDVPTLTSATAANFCTLNPLAKASLQTLSDGNLTLADSGSNSKVLGTIGVTSGKWYWEIVPFASANQMIGIALTTSPISQYPGQDANSWCWYQGNGGVKINNSTQTAYATFTNNDVIGVALDLSAGTITFYKNNTSQGVAFSSLPAGTYTPALGYTGSMYANFGQRPFTYTPPTGFVALNTYNLPDSTIVKGNTVMDATLYTGTLLSNAITNAASFKPDLVWLKSRSAATSHKLTDSVRGVTIGLVSNTTAAETTDTQGLTAFGSAGFTVGTNTDYNNLAATYVGWQWQAGQGSTSSNTNGNVTSTVSVNASAGFSVVTYTVTSTASMTIGHGLGVAPQLIIEKRRDSAANWDVYTAATGNTGRLQLNSTAAFDVQAGVWNNTTPTSTVFSQQGNGTWHPIGATCVAYCWTPIAGFSAFGSYTGNGSADGPFTYVGFRPKFVIIKRTDTAGFDWCMYDTSRSPSNVVIIQLFANTAQSESGIGSDNFLDILSNGFKNRNTAADKNASGGTYIYMAFAENPFKNALAR